MTAPPSIETLLRHGVRDLIEALDPGCPVISGFLQPGKAEHAAIGVVTYDTGDLTEQIAGGQTTVSVQVTIRGSAFGGSDPVSDLRQLVRDALTWIMPRQVNGLVVVSSVRQLVSGPPVIDSQGRPTVFDTYDMRSGRLGLIPA